MRKLRIFISLVLVAIAVLPFAKILPGNVRGATYTSGPVFHTSAGRFFAVQYDTSLSQAQIETATGYLNQYIPQLFNLFWEPQEDAYIVVTQGGCGGYSCGGSDGISLLSSSWNLPNVWVHELTHVLQFYGTGPGVFLSGDAFLLYAEPTAKATADILAPFESPPDCCTDLSFWTKDQGVGLAANDYALQSYGEGHVPVNIWTMLHEADPDVFKEMNSRLHELTQQYVQLSDIPSFRELIRQSTSLQTLDNLPIKQWLAVEGFLGRNEVGTNPITYVAAANYYSPRSGQQLAQAVTALATSNGFLTIDQAQSRGTVSDAFTRAKLADLSVQSSADVAHGVSFQASLNLQSVPAVVRLDLHVVAAGFSEDRSILAPLTQYQGYSSAPTLGATGLIAIPTVDMWLQNLNGNAIVNGQTYPITNGIAKINLEGSATVTLNTGTTIQITGFVKGQQLAVGLDYDALRIMQDTGTITTTTQTTIPTFSTSTTPTVTIVETTSPSTASASTTQTQSSMSSSTRTILSTTSYQSSTEVVTLHTISNPTTSSTSESTLVSTTEPSNTITGETSASDFHLSISPDAINLAQSASGAFTVSVQSVGSFDQPVNLEATGLPTGVEISFSPDPVSPSKGGMASSTANLIATRAVPTGVYSSIIVATSGTVSKQVALSLRVSGCLIATASFGSELAPEVEFLRDFRDNKILRTFAGSGFMMAFNAWYYSFSPAVAEYESVNPLFRASVKYLIYPLIWFLQFGAFLFDLMSFNGEAAAVVSGIFVSASVGAAYLSGPLLVAQTRFRARHRRSVRKLEEASFWVFAASLLLVVFSEILRVQVFMMASSSVAVLATVTMSAIWTSRTILVFLDRMTKN